MIPVFSCTADKGNLKIYKPFDFKMWLCKLNGKELELIVQRKSKKRTNPENSYYWSVVVRLLSDELGYTPDEMNMVLKQKFLPIHKEPFDTCGSFKKLSTVEFEKKMTEIREFASIEIGIYIPLPNEIMIEEIQND